MSRNKEPEVGDLIEISRRGYQHWAIYVGEGYVIHIALPSEGAHAGSSSRMSARHDKACVKKEKLSDVAGNDKYKVNNLLDNEYEPRDIKLIVKEAHSRIGEEMPYSLVSRNCEHFVTDLRYGKPTSRQVRSAVDVGAGVGTLAAFHVFGIWAIVVACYLILRKK